ncbi:ParB and winged helix-turn-helix domain-containing protein [Amycolatopsis arida]|uniref:ParB and winged helix-turn-helix domain-containing protein n=1 Tax=Amycolatopsis arida TaxID=587909 RepID=UPI001AB027DB|nr:helix-turn-helix domain-containing protein [Amycolatopsis arida]
MRLDSPRTLGADLAHAQLLAQSAADLPPILVNRRNMRVIDGWHRVLAAELNGRAEIAARLVDCTDREAFVLSVRMNVAHGLPLTLAERTAAAERILASHPQWSDRAIASVTGLAHKTVGSVRRRVGDRTAPDGARRGRDGRVRPRDAARGRRAAARMLEERPGASLREIARAVGISPATVRDVRARLERGEDPVLASPRRYSESTSDEWEGGAGAFRPDAGRVSPLFPVSPTASPGPEVSTALRNLRQDPSLRFSESGRLLLRLLEAATLLQREWCRLSEAVPAHHADVVVMVARSCGLTWHAFATELERKGRRPRQSSG